MGDHETELMMEVNALRERSVLFEADSEAQERIFSETVELVKRIVRDPNLSRVQVRQILNSISMSSVDGLD